jgi:hypothetical protein
MNTFGAAPELDWADNLLITMPDAVWAQRVAFDPFDLTLSWPGPRRVLAVVAHMPHRGTVREVTPQ